MSFFLRYPATVTATTVISAPYIMWLLEGSRGQGSNCHSFKINDKRSEKQIIPKPRPRFCFVIQYFGFFALSYICYSHNPRQILVSNIAFLSPLLGWGQAGEMPAQR